MVLFLSLGVMTILLSISLMFASYTISRQAITNNQMDAFKARCIAQSGIADALNQLMADPSSGSDIGTTDFGGGTYSVDLQPLGNDQVRLTATGSYGRGTYTTKVRVDLPSDEGCIYAWALREGVSHEDGQWFDSYEAHDDARGPNNWAAYMTAKGVKEHGVAGFRIESMPYPITKVELIMCYYIPQYLKSGHIDMRWRRVSNDKKGPWKDVKDEDLNLAMGTGGRGFIAMDKTSDDPPEGWIWELFTMDTDFQIQVDTDDLKAYFDTDRFYIDCVGFRISWGGYDPPDPVGWGVVIKDDDDDDD